MRYTALVFSKVRAAGFDGDVLDFGTPARRAAVLVSDAPPPGRWTAFERPVSFLNDSCGCLVLGLDDVAALRGHHFASPRLRDFIRILDAPASVPGRGISLIDGALVWVTPMADAHAILSVLYGLISEEMIRALSEGRLDDVNSLAWRLWRAALSPDEKALAIVGLERSRYPEHARHVMGRPSLLSKQDREVFDGLLLHARRGVDWALRFQASLAS